MIRELIFVALGGAIGASLRHGTGVFLVARLGAASWPWWLIGVNVFGSFLIGMLWGAMQDGRIAPIWGPFLATGILGGFTTFSAFSLDVIRLAQEGRVEAAGAYVVASVVFSIFAAYLGLILIRALS